MKFGYYELNDILTALNLLLRSRDTMRFSTRRVEAIRDRVAADIKEMHALEFQQYLVSDDGED